MRRKSMLMVALILLPVFASLFMGLVKSQPLPIGDLGYIQANPFDSNPTTGAYSGVGTPTGTIGNAFDGDLGTSIAFGYGYDAAGYVEVHAFKKPSDNGLTDFAITFIDIKISYKAASTSANDDQYRFVAILGGNTVVLMDWVTGNAAKYDPGTGAQGHQTFSNVARPGGGSWTWTDMANLKVQVDCQVVNTNNFQKVTLYEVWITAYSTAYPNSGTISVQPSAVAGLHAGDVFYIDVYVTDVTNMWGYQVQLNFDENVLQALEYMSYGPFVTALPSEIGTNYVAVAYKTFDGDPTGFTGNTPIARIYFAVVSDGTSLLTLVKAECADAFGQLIALTPKSGLFASNPVRDVAVIDVTVNATNVLPGEFLEINATVMNQGTVQETFDVTAFYDSNPIDTLTVTDLQPGMSEDLSFIWDTSGVALGFYQIKVEATMADDANPSNNVKVWNLVPEGVLVGRHDIAVTDVVRAYSNGTVVSGEEVCNVTRGDIVYINATIENKGDFFETFNITAVWREQYNIGNITDMFLSAGTSKNVTFVWNTDITYPPWIFGFDRFGNPVNFSRGPVEVVAAPGWTEEGYLYAKGVPYEKNLPFYDYTGDNVRTSGDVRVNRDLRYPTAKFNQRKSELFVGEPVIFEGGPPNYSQTPTGTTIDKYRWDFGDGNVTEGNYSTITHVYTSPGKYSINLTVTNSIGLQSSTATGKLGGPIIPIRVAERNIRIVSVVANPTCVAIGQNVAIDVAIRNDGVRDEDLTTLRTNVTVYYDDTVIAKIAAPSLGAWNSATNSSTVAFHWDTSGLSPGTYTITAVLDILPYENNTVDNTWVAGPVTLIMPHDIAVTSVAVSSGRVMAGDPVTITVAVENQGDFPETFSVTVFYDDTVAAPSKTVLDLAAKASVTLKFTWDTTGDPVGDYIVKAQASIVPGEVDTGDNTFVNGKVTISHRTLTIELSGELDYLMLENVRIKLAALVKDASTMEPVSNASVKIEIYDASSKLWTSSVMVEKPTRTGIYEWTSSRTIRDLRLEKGVYLVRVQASYGGGPTAHDILLFHIDPPAEEANEMLHYIVFTIVALIGVIGVFFGRRQIANRLRHLKTRVTTQIAAVDYCGMKLLKGRIWKVAVLVWFVIEALLSSIAVVSMPVYAGSAVIAVDPPTIVDTTLTLGSTFSINITIANVEKLWGYQYVIFYNSSIINATKFELLDNRFTKELPSGIGANFVFVARATYDGDLNGITTVDPIPVDRIDFTVTGYGTTGLTFNSPQNPTYTQLASVEGEEIDAVLVDGFFANVLPSHDVAVTKVSASPTSVMTGETVTIDVTVSNEGAETETFNVIVKYDDIEIETKTVTNLVSGRSETLSFSWNTVDVTPGTYKISAETSPVSGDINPDNNALIDGEVTVLKPPTLLIKLVGEFDYLLHEPVKIRLDALVKDPTTMQPVSNAVVNVEIYDAAGQLWISKPMQEKIPGSGIYEWTSTNTIAKLRLSKGIYLVRASASLKDGPVAYDILEFHIDPPAEETNEMPYYIAFAVVALAGATGLLLIRRHSINRLRQPSQHI